MLPSFFILYIVLEPIVTGFSLSFFRFSLENPVYAQTIADVTSSELDFPGKDNAGVSILNPDRSS
ncbi:hypothetical protein BDV18DRAFT_146625 [Aspergillus unguis]